MLLKIGSVVRAYAMEVVTTSNRPTTQQKRKILVLEGLIFISDIQFHALFYTGASHSFISCSMVSCFHIELDLVYDPCCF